MNRLTYRSNKCHAINRNETSCLKTRVKPRRNNIFVINSAVEMHGMFQINHEIIPKMPSRCSVEQYDRMCHDKNRHAENQQMLADSVLK